MGLRVLAVRLDGVPVQTLGFFEPPGAVLGDTLLKRDPRVRCARLGGAPRGHPIGVARSPRDRRRL